MSFNLKSSNLYNILIYYNLYIRSINDAREKLTQLQKTISEIQSSVQSPDKTDHTLQSLQTKSAPQLEVANDDDNETG